MNYKHGDVYACEDGSAIVVQRLGTSLAAHTNP